MNIAIIGNGKWGMALGTILSKNHKVKIWSYTNNKKEMHNLNIECSNDFEYVLKDTNLILHCTSSKYVRSVVRQYAPYIDKQSIILCSKGWNLISGIEQELKLANKLSADVGILSGPSHAEEVIENMATGLVISSKNIVLNELVRHLFKGSNIKIYVGKDVRSIELGGSLKNAYAVGFGIISALNYGDNAKALFFTRALKEMGVIMLEFDSLYNTSLLGLTGVGDLFVTCLSNHSRNMGAGKMVAEGKSVKEIETLIGEVVEGFNILDMLYQCSDIHSNLFNKIPIAISIYNAVYKQEDPHLIIQNIIDFDKDIMEF